MCLIFRTCSTVNTISCLSCAPDRGLTHTFRCVDGAPAREPGAGAVQRSPTTSLVAWRGALPLRGHPQPSLGSW